MTKRRKVSSTKSITEHIIMSKTYKDNEKRVRQPEGNKRTKKFPTQNKIDTKYFSPNKIKYQYEELTKE